MLNKVPLHDVKVGVWCATSATKIIGPIFFFWDHSIHMDTLHMFWPTLFSARQCNISNHKQFYVFFSECSW